MQTTSVISRIKAILQNKLPQHDNRCKIQPLEFITALICSFSVREGRVTSISSMRHSVMEYTQIKLARGTFWERVATKKTVKLLQILLGHLMADLCLQMKVSKEILNELCVKKIFLLDASSFTLPDGASRAFPAPRNNVVPAAVKVHALYDIFGGMVKWFEITPATTHDRKGFPPLHFLAGSLIIFDLGYWDFQLLKDMMDVGAYFLSRVKKNATLKVVEVASGISPSCIGVNLSGGRLDGFRGKIVEFIGELKVPKTGECFRARVIGFWSTEDSQYHWYITNLKVSSVVMYSLYSFRWQLELLWKAWKSFLHLDEINTTNKNIIQCVILSGMCAGLLAGAIAVSTVNEESEEKQAAYSVQSAANLFIRMGKLFFDVVCRQCRGAKKRLLEMIYLFKEELFSPNYKKGNNAVGRFKKALFVT